MGGLIGRHLELSAVLERLKAARGRTESTIFVRGEAGIGKSRLLAEVLDQARLLGYTVLTGRADELEQEVPYVALREAIEPALQAEREVRLLDAVESVQRALLLRPDASSTADSAATAQPDRSALQLLYAEGERLLRAWSDRQPVVLALDDLHAADRDTVTVMSLLARHLAGARVVLFATMRRHAPDRNLELETLVDRLADSGRAITLDLEPLDHEDVRALVGTQLGGPAMDGVIDHVWDLSRGNPFFAEEAVRCLQESGTVREIDGLWHLSGASEPVAASRRNTVLSRVFRLGRPVRSVARAASTLQSVPLDRIDLLASLARTAETEVARALDDLVEANVLRETRPATLEFVHPIVRSTLYEDLGPTERRRMHAAVAAYLTERRGAGQDVSITEIAVHVAESVESGDERGAQLLAEAGDAASRTAPQSAAGWFARALEVLPIDHPSAGRLLARRSRSLYLAGRFDEAATAGSDALHRLGPGRDAARTAALVVSALTSAHRFTEALELADSILARSPSPMSRLRTQRASLLQYLNRFDEAREEGQRALQLSEDDPAGRAAALGQLGGLAFAQGDVGESLALLDSQLELACELGPATHLSALVQRAVYLALFGMVREADVALVDARKQSTELGEAAFRSTLEVAGVVTDWLGGRWDDAVTRWQVVKGSETESYVAGLARWAVVAILTSRGRHADAAREMVEIEDGAVFTTSIASWATAALAAASGRPEEALEVLRAAVSADLASGRRSALALLLAQQVQVELESGDTDAARSTGALLDAVGAETHSPWVRVLTLRASAMLHDRPDHAADALTLSEDNGLVVEAARCRATLARLGVDPPGNLVAAHEVFTRLGAEQERRAVAAELRRRSLRVPRGRRARPGGLTATDVELARLVHEGKTNREIASLLHLSPKTIEVYLTRLFAKAGVANRLDLALAVTDGRLDTLTGTS
ncbi:MAG TPA: AAA family ATPase [Acidimicrobiales bacterium]|nr:AAA family ATPase [Acidimicrobiales bacterium]